MARKKWELVCLFLIKKEGIFFAKLNKGRKAFKDFAMKNKETNCGINIK